MTACFGCVSCLLGCFNPCIVCCSNATESTVQARTTAQTSQNGYAGASQVLGLLERAGGLVKSVLESENWNAAVGVMRSGTVGCLANCPKWLQCICNCCYACATGNEEMSPEDVADYLKHLEAQYSPVVLAAAYEFLLEEGDLPKLMEGGFMLFSQTLRQTCNQIMVEMKLLEFTCKVKASRVSEAESVDCVDGIPQEVNFCQCDYRGFCKTLKAARAILNLKT